MGNDILETSWKNIFTLASVRTEIKTDHSFTFSAATIAIANVGPLSGDVPESIWNAYLPAYVRTYNKLRDTTYSFNASSMKHFCTTTVFGRIRVREGPFVHRRSSRWSARLHRVNLSFFLSVLASLRECFFSPVTMLNELSYRAWRCSHRMYRCLHNHLPMGSFRALAKENVACRTLLKNSSFSRQFAKAQRTPLFFTLRLRRRPKRTPRNDSWGIYVSHEWFP